jgi:hypothetical protein
VGGAWAAEAEARAEEAQRMSGDIEPLVMRSPFARAGVDHEFALRQTMFTTDQGDSE